MYQRGLNVDIQKQNMNICALIKYFCMLFTYSYKYRKSLNSDGQQNEQLPLSPRANEPKKDHSLYMAFETH
jgi:hypothetical protein